MKNEYPQITLFGSNSGNNVGDAAILSAILEAVTKELPTARFLVPTTNPTFINSNYGKKYQVQALNIMPWNFTLRFLGWPALKCLWKSDVAIVCDGIIFGKRLFNPAFNMLLTLAPLAFFAKLLGCKFGCYSVGIGPFPKGRGKRLARYLIQSCDLVMMREAESKRLAERIGVTKPIELTGDAAFINSVSSAQRALEICKLEGIDESKAHFGINITSYVDTWMNEGGERSDVGALINRIAEGVSLAQKQTTDAFRPIIFSTHPMDETVAKQLASALQAPIVSNTKYLSHDLQAVMRLCSLFMGMRFHSLVLSSAVGAPIVGLVYAPKVKGLMEDLGSPEYAVNLATLRPETLAKVIVSAWNERTALQARQQMVVKKFKEGAERAAKLLATRFFPSLAKAEPTDQTLNMANG